MDWDVQHYDIALDLDPDARLATGRIAITVAAVADNPGPLVLDCDGPQVVDVLVDGQPVDWTPGDATIEVPLAGDAVVTVDYTTRGATQDEVWGLRWGPPIMTFSEPFGARHWLVVVDDPSDKATIAWHVTAPSELTVVANGDRVGIASAGGRTTWDYALDGPIATYLLVVDAGEFALDVDESGPVPVWTWAPPELLGPMLDSAGDTPGMIAYLSTVYGDYRWSRYGNVIVPFGGGMEHTTATSFGDQLVGDDGAEWVNVHELGHHWWGDDVTCADFDQIWLNEGFASYTELVWAEHTLGPDYAAAYRRSKRQDYLDWHDIEGVSAVVPPNFTWGGTVYDKGALVLHMLRQAIGDDAFLAGLADYRAEHSGGAATTDDLETAMSLASGEDLAWFFDQWVYRPGDPAVTWDVTSTPMTDGTWQVDVQVAQAGPETWRFPLVIEGTLDDGTALSGRPWVEGATATFTWCTGSPAGEVALDPHSDVLFDSLERVEGGFDAPAIVCGDVGSVRGGACDSTGTGSAAWLPILGIGAAVTRRTRKRMGSS
jgi:aminopeptidase N